METNHMSYKDQISQLAEKLGVDKEVVTEIGAIVESAIAKGIEAREKELTEQVEQAAKEAAQVVAEQRAAIEAEVKAQAEAVAQQFVAENRERFVQTERYDNMVAFVDQIQEAFAVAGLGTDNLDKVSALQEQVAHLEQQLAEAQDRADTADASNILREMIAEANLSLLQQERVGALLRHTKPDNLSEFRSIAENIIAEVKKDEDDEADEDETKDDKDKPKDDVSERMQRYLQAAQAH
nr:MAG TPA: hypothetical protein [Caudoviricetes sp.]